MLLVCEIVSLFKDLDYPRGSPSKIITEMINSVNFKQVIAIKNGLARYNFSKSFWRSLPPNISNEHRIIKQITKVSLLSLPLVFTV